MKHLLYYTLLFPYGLLFVGGGLWIGDVFITESDQMTYGFMLALFGGGVAAFTYRFVYNFIFVFVLGISCLKMESFGTGHRPF
jgi:hypothetical protein